MIKQLKRLLGIRKIINIYVAWQTKRSYPESTYSKKMWKQLQSLKIFSLSTFPHPLTAAIIANKSNPPPNNSRLSMMEATVAIN